MQHWSIGVGLLGMSVEHQAWAAGHPDPASAFLACERADWLLSVLASNDADPQVLALTICDCVEDVLVYLPSDEPRPRLALQLARAWARGEATASEVWDASVAASGAADALADRAAVCAARAAADAARSGAMPISYGRTAIVAAAEAGEAAGAASVAASLARFADRVRGARWPIEPLTEGFEACRPALQIAWDRVSGEVGGSHVDTVRLMTSFVVQAEISAHIDRPSWIEGKLIRALSHRIACAGDLQRQLDAVIPLLEADG